MEREDEIAGRIRKGDIKTFETLFRSSYASLVRYAKSIVKDHDAAEEIVQDLFFRLWKDKEKLTIESSLNGYLFRSVYNRCIHHLEHRKVVAKYETDMAFLGEESPVTPVQQLQYRELQALIAQTLGNLPGKCGEIFYLNRFEGLKYREIAERLSVSVKTVEANMGKALKEFRKALATL